MSRKPHIINVEEMREFVNNSRVLMASDSYKRLWVTCNCTQPGFLLETRQTTEESYHKEEYFSDLAEAVQRYNES